jgi:hypothetical protein
MRRMLKPIAFILLNSVSCRSASDHTGADSDSATKTGSVIEAIHVPEFRKEVNKEPVAEYKEKVNEQLDNNWYFSVRLFETDKTLSYRVKMQYEELQGEDTLRLPDLGMLPRPVIRKGPDKYSCILGFIDQDSAFREYKLVYVKGKEMGIRALKHYAVTQGYRLESQDVR